MSTLEISRSLQCSKEALYNAWTDPQELKQWWKPMGNQLTEVQSDLKKGGMLQYRFEKDSLTIDGQYEEVNENELLVYSWNWHLSAEPIHDAAYKLSISFKGDENSSTISISQDGFENEESIQPHQQGWEQGLEQLKTYLETNSKNQAENQTLNESQQQRPPISGYNETPEQVKVGGG